MDGTPCGELKVILNKFYIYLQWCISGKCILNKSSVEKKSIKIKITNFFLGCKNLNDSYCNNLPREKLTIFCKAPSFKKICCSTCFNHNNSEINKKKIQRKKLLEDL